MDKSALYIGIVSISSSILATVAAPIIALRFDRKREQLKEKLSRKTWIFKTLMGYRATRLNHNFVQALNLIDIEFIDNSESNVRFAWKELLNHYTEWGAKTEDQRKIENKQDVETSNDLLAQMLVVMGNGLGYTFDKVYIKKAFYYPEGLGSIEAEQHQLRRGLLALLSGKGAKLPIAMFTQDFTPLRAHTATSEQPPQGLEAPPIQSLAPKAVENESA